MFKAQIEDLHMCVCMCVCVSVSVSLSVCLYVWLSVRVRACVYVHAWLLHVFVSITLYRICTYLRKYRPMVTR